MFDRLSFLRSSLGIKFLAPIVVLGTVVVAVGAVIGTQAINEVLGERVRQRGEELASTLEHAARLWRDRDDLQRLVAALGTREDIGLIVITSRQGSQQKVVACSEPAWVGKDLASLSDERLRALRSTPQNSAPTIAYGEPVDFHHPIEMAHQPSGSQGPGECLIRITGERLRAERTGIFWQAAGYTLCTALAMTVLAMSVFGVSTLRPIVELERAMRGCADGDLSVRAQVTSDDELGQLASRFNELIDQLQTGQALTAAHAAALEQAHQESEFLRRAIDQHAIISISDASGRIVAVNDQMCQTSGYDRRELLGQTHSLLNSGKHPGEMWRRMYEDCSRGKSWHAEVCNRRKDGGLYWIDTTVTPLLGVDGRIERFIAISTDITPRKIAESELNRQRDTLRRLAMVVERTDNSVMITDTGGRIEWVNAAFSRVTGYLPDDVIGRSPRVILERNDIDAEATRRMAGGIASGRGFREQVILYTKDERRLWIDIECEPLLDDAGQLTGFMALGRDITRQKESDLQLQRLARRLLQATTGTGIGVWDFDLLRDEVWWDDAMHELYGSQAGDFEQNYAGWCARLHPDDLPATEQLFRLALAGEAEFRTNFRVIHPDGSIRRVEAAATIERDEDGMALRAVGINQDITERYAAEERLALAMAAAQQGLWDWNLTTGQIFFDDLWFRMLGYSPGELPMDLLQWDSLVHEEDLARLVDQRARHLCGQLDLYRCERRLKTRDGAWKWFLDLGKVIDRDPAGRPLRMVGVQIDIDDQKRTLQQLEQATLAAEASSRAKSEFLANMSHEIRTPMTAILGYADLLLDDREADATQLRGDYLDTIRRHGHHLLEIVNDILDLSKIEAGKLTVEKLSIPVAETIDDVVRLMRVRVAGRPVNLVTELDPGLPSTIASDPTRLRQILVNLLGNAIKFTQDGAVTLRISFERSDLDRGDADRGAIERGVLRCEVRDTGIGISAEKLSQLFQPFSQTDGSMSRRFGGTGLGLAISRRLAQMLGGNITVESRLGVGSTFTLLLPTEVVEDGSQTSLAQRAVHDHDLGEEIPSLQGIRVLLAEDSYDNARLISHLLRRADIEVDHADNGRIAMEMILAAQAAGRSYDCVLMDMQMPELDGYQATSALRIDGYTGPIVALTAHAMSGEREKCLAAGCDDYTTKPIDRARLLTMVGKWANATGDQTA